jgi:CBS domain containing-hemolysin-like protein
MDTTTLSLAAFAVLTALCAFFAGTETAYLTLPRASLEAILESRRAGASAVRALYAEPRKLILSLKVGLLFTRLALASLAGLIAYGFASDRGLPIIQTMLVEVLGIGVFVLLFGEMIPRTAVFQHRETIVVLVAPVVRLYCGVMGPIAQLLLRFLHGLAALFGREERVPYLTAEELIAVVEGGEDGASLELEKEEREMIQSIFEFGDTTVREVMVPRIDMVSIEVSEPLDAVLNLIAEKGHSRIPVYQERVDQIVGIVYAKDLLRVVRRAERDGVSLRELVRKPFFVPETKKIDDLLREFQKEKTHMAIVVDEYGGTAGIVTLEDVIEEIVGEIHDEYDREEPLFVVLPGGVARVAAKVGLEEFSERMGTTVSAEGCDTLGGYLYRLIGSVPKGGEIVQDEQFRYTVEKVLGQRITMVRVERIGEESGAAQAVGRGAEG